MGPTVIDRMDGMNRMGGIDGMNPRNLAGDRGPGALRAVIFDWAGTMIDHGSRAPVEVILEVFRRRGVELREAEARGPMGMNKLDHLKTLLADAAIAARWAAATGAPPREEDAANLYREFLPLQHEVLRRRCTLIPGAVAAVAECRRRGMKIGATTGYTAELMQFLVPEAARQGYSPDADVTSEGLPAGRPAPWMIFEAARRMNVYPMSRVVKVDDTPIGIEAGRNAGTWNVGVLLTGNEVGLDEEPLAALHEWERLRLRSEAARRMKAAGAHCVIDGVADLAEALDEIEARIARGERP